MRRIGPLEETPEMGTKGDEGVAVEEEGEKENWKRKEGVSGRRRWKV